MRVPRIFLEQAIEPGADMALDGRSAHYLANVLRMKAGMALTVFDGSGREYPATLIALGRKDGSISLGDGVDPGTESRLHTILGIGISRGERMDYVVQKSTECGVNVIQPLFTEFCEVRLDDKRMSKRLEHWRQVCISACEQSGRVVLPAILAPLSLNAWAEDVQAERKFLLHQGERKTVETGQPPATVALLVGPEGGLSDKEKALAQDKGFSGLSLGTRTLRTETAPVAALGLFQYLWGN